MTFKNVCKNLKRQILWNGGSQYKGYINSSMYQIVLPSLLFTGSKVWYSTLYSSCSEPHHTQLCSFVKEWLKSLLEVKFSKWIALFEDIVWELLQCILQIKLESVSVWTTRSEWPHDDSVASCHSEYIDEGKIPFLFYPAFIFSDFYWIKKQLLTNKFPSSLLL